MYTPQTTVVTYYFRPKYHGVVLGLTSTGFGTAMIIMPPLVEWLIQQYGWQGSVLLQIGLNLHLVVCAAVLRPTPSMVAFTTNDTGSQRAIWRKSEFVLLSVQQFICSLGLSVVFVHLAYSIEVILNVDRATSGLVISVSGISNVIARVVVGVIVKLPGVDALLQYAVQCGMTGAAVLLVPFVTSMPLMMFVAVLIGFGYSLYGAVLPVVIGQIVGKENLTAGIGAIHLGFGLGLCLGAPIAGLAYDLSKDYNTTLYFGGAVMVLSMFMMFPSIIKRRRQASIVERTNPTHAEVQYECHM